MSTINIALVGYGYWGPNLLRNFLLTENCTVTYICDMDKKRLQKVKEAYPNIKTTDNIADILHDKNINAIIIATPPESHYVLAKNALLADKDVFIEKPLATSVKEAEELVMIAKKRKKILMVDHTYIYSGAVQKLKEIIEKKKIGKIVSINSTRINLGLYQSSVNVIQDLAIHDFSILDYILGSMPLSVLTIGGKHFDNKQEDQAHIHLWYRKNILVTIHVSWLSPVKKREMLICGTKKMIVYDDIENSEKVKIFDAGVSIERNPLAIQQMKIGYRRGDIYSPYVEVKEALSTVTSEFVNAVITRKAQLSDGDFGLRVVKITEAALDSLKTGKRKKIVNV